MLKTIEFEGLPLGVTIQVDEVLVIGTQNIPNKEEKKES
jgi:hypothetical protein